MATRIIRFAVVATYVLAALAFAGLLYLRGSIAMALAVYVCALAIAPPRGRLALILPLLAVDCLANMLLARGSWRNTLSGEAWQQRQQPYFFWTHAYIDGLFQWQPNHCATAANAEAFYGSIWRWWAASWVATKQGA